jgi:hypothetical protein
LEVLILNDFKSLFPEVLILIDFKSFAPEVLILVGLKSLGMIEIREFSKLSEVLILGVLRDEKCANSWILAGFAGGAANADLGRSGAEGPVRTGVTNRILGFGAVAP